MDAFNTIRRAGPGARRAGTVVLVGWASLAAGDRPRFAPEPGLTVSKSFELSYEMQFDDFSLEVDGEDLGAMIGVPELFGEGLTTARFTDTYLELEGGRPTKLVRSFEESTSEMDMSFSILGQSADQVVSTDGAVEGIEVVFTWNPDTQTYDTSFAEGSEGNADLLERLEANTDLRGIVPDRDVSEGDEWEIDAAFLLQLMMPSGDMHYDMAPFASDEIDMDEMQDLIEPMVESSMDLYCEMLTGTANATYLGRKQLDDRELAEIGIEVELDKLFDMTGMLEEMIGMLFSTVEEVPPDLTIDIALADMGLSLYGEGTALWDLERNVLYGLELEVDTDWTFDLEVSGGMDGESVTASVSVAGSGPYRSEVRFR